LRHMPLKVGLRNSLLLSPLPLALAERSSAALGLSPIAQDGGRGVPLSPFVNVELPEPLLDLGQVLRDIEEVVSRRAVELIRAELLTLEYVAKYLAVGAADRLVGSDAGHGLSAGRVQQTHDLLPIREVANLRRVDPLHRLAALAVYPL